MSRTNRIAGWIIAVVNVIAAIGHKASGDLTSAILSATAAALVLFFLVCFSKPPAK